jgi:hypothetical protein
MRKNENIPKEPMTRQWHAKLNKLTTATGGSTNVVQLPALLSESVEREVVPGANEGAYGTRVERPSRAIAPMKEGVGRASKGQVVRGNYQEPA